MSAILFTVEAQAIGRGHGGRSGWGGYGGHGGFGNLFSENSYF